LAGLLELTDAKAVEKWQAAEHPNDPLYTADPTLGCQPGRIAIL
jgi:hypothetical protein